jgi:ABC-type polysaccharide/polyol phosphate export permease
MTVGYIVWVFISEIMGGVSRLYVRSKGASLSGGVNHVVLHLRLIARATIKFLNQAIIIVGVCLVFGIVPTKNALFLLPTILLLFVHAYWVSVVFSLVGARGRDIPQTTDIIMRKGVRLYHFLKTLNLLYYRYSTILRLIMQKHGSSGISVGKKP